MSTKNDKDKDDANNQKVVTDLLGGGEAPPNISTAKEKIKSNVNILFESLKKKK